MVIFRARRKIHRSMRRVFEGLPPDCRPARDPGPRTGDLPPRGLVTRSLEGGPGRIGAAPRTGGKSVTGAGETTMDSCGPDSARGGTRGADRAGTGAAPRQGRGGRKGEES